MMKFVRCFAACMTQGVQAILFREDQVYKIKTIWRMKRVKGGGSKVIYLRRCYIIRFINYDFHLLRLLIHISSTQYCCYVKNKNRSCYSVSFPIFNCFTEISTTATFAR